MPWRAALLHPSGAKVKLHDQGRWRKQVIFRHRSADCLDPKPGGSTEGVLAMNGERRCPNCDAAALRTWAELSAEEREVVRRLPSSQNYDAEERKSVHRWCTRCWYEKDEDQPRVV
jgi:hypothetical protein